MKFLNVSVSGLRGRLHPSLKSITTTFQVKKTRPYIKMLCMDYYTYEKRANQSGGSGHCRACAVNTDQQPHNSHTEDIAHILTVCSAYSDIRGRIFPEFENLCKMSKSGFIFSDVLSQKHELCQFILDPSSFNLSPRISMNDPYLYSFFQLSIDYCYSVHQKRMTILDVRAANK